MSIVRIITRHYTSYYREYSNFYSSGGFGLIVIGGGLALGGIIRMVLRSTKSPPQQRPEQRVSAKNNTPWPSSTKSKSPNSNMDEATESKSQEQKPSSELSSTQVNPINLLKLRLAKGEITKAEYEDLKKMLE